MQTADGIIIGGGPAGSTCAGKLRDGGLDVLIVDKAEFPRSKLCSGWITPGVLDDLKLDVEDYCQGRVFQPMSGFSIGQVGGTSVKIDYGQTVSYGILRRQFDDYLLRRCGARLALGEAVKSIEQSAGAWVVNGQYKASLLVAAGGHFCPVARLLGKASERGPAISAQEMEIELRPDQQSACLVEQTSPELYFCDDLLGYGWCFRKGNHLNIGLGRVDPQHLPQRVNDFYAWLKQQRRLPDDLPSKFPGHAYLTYDQAARPLAATGVLWIGDAAGLAYAESGEGIRPAIQSGLMAAETILAARGDYRLQTLDGYRRRMESHFGPRASSVPSPRVTSDLRRRLAHWLLRQRWFVRRVVLDRWFLRTQSRQKPGFSRSIP
jgi:flavin-dependent dehydrogenase